MSDWQGALALLRFEGRRSWVGLLITMLFFTYASVILMPLFNETLMQDNQNNFGWVGDFLYLTILPTMGFLMNKSAFRYWSLDPHTRKLAYWRTLPISWNAIVLYRMLQHLIVLTVVSLYFFTLQYILLSELRQQMAPGDYVLYVLIWYGYALMAGTTYVFFEQTRNGKAYFMVCISYLLVYLLIGCGLWLTHMDLVVKTIEVSRNHHFVWPAVSLLIGFASMACIGRFIRMQLAKRSLLQ